MRHGWLRPTSGAISFTSPCCRCTLSPNMLSEPWRTLLLVPSKLVFLASWEENGFSCLLSSVVMENCTEGNRSRSCYGKVNVSFSWLYDTKGSLHRGTCVMLCCRQWPGSIWQLLVRSSSSLSINVGFSSVCFPTYISPNTDYNCKLSFAPSPTHPLALSLFLSRLHPSCPFGSTDRLTEFQRL